MILLPTDRKNKPYQTRVTSDNNKRVLSSPLDREDLKKQRALSLSSNTTEPPEMEESLDESSQVSCKDKDLQRISALLASSFESRLTSIVSNVVDGVLNHLSTKVDTLEKENSDLRTKVEELQSKLEKTTADLEQTNEYSRRNSLRISGISESSDNSTDEAVLHVAKEVGSAITIVYGIHR